MQIKQNNLSRTAVVLCTAIMFIVISISGYNSFKGGTSADWIVKVANKEYSLDDYQEFFSELKNDKSGATQHLNIKDEALNRLVEAALIETEAKNIGLVISDKMIKSELQAIPMFKDEAGKFSKDKLSSFLRRNGSNERIFIEKMRRFFLRKQLMQIFRLNRNAAYPGVIDAMIGAIYDKRQVNLFKISKEDLKGKSDKATVAAVTASEIDQFFSRNEEKFRIPEVRNISYLLLDSSALIDPATAKDISQVEIEEEYKKQKAYLRIPENRDVEQLVCNDKEVIDLAYSKLLAGEKFDKIRAKYETPYAYSHSIKNVVPEEHFDRDLSRILFNLDKGGFSQPHQTALGWHIFYIKEVRPSREKTFAEVKDRLIEEIVLMKNQEKLFALVKKIDRDLKSQKGLDAIAQEYRIELKEANITIKKTPAAIDPATDKNNDETQNYGKEIPSASYLQQSVANLEELPVVVTIAQNTPQGQVSSPEEISRRRNDTTHVVLRVNKIIPTRIIRPEEQKLSKMLLEEKNNAALQTLAKQIYEKTQDSRVIKRLHHKPRPVIISRIMPLPEGVSLKLAAEIFDLEPKQKSKLNYDSAKNIYFFAELDEIQHISPDENKQLLRSFHEQILEFYFDTIGDEYLAYLKKKYKPEVNRARIDG